MCYLEKFDALETSYRDLYYRDGIEYYILNKGDKDLIRDFEKNILSDSFDPISYMKDKNISEKDFPKVFKDQYLSMINTGFVLAFLFNASENICSIVMKRAFATLRDFIVSNEEVVPGDIYDKALQLPNNFANAFFMAIVDNTTLKDNLLSYFALNRKIDFKKVINEIGIASFARPYSWLCIAIDFAEAFETDVASIPSLENYINDNDYESYAHWISSIYSYIVYDLDMGGAIDRHPEFANQSTIYIEKSNTSNKKQSTQNRIHFATELVNREQFFEKLINDNWVALPDNELDYDIELIDRLKFFFYDNNDKPSVDVPQDYQIKWCKKTISLNFLIRLLNNIDHDDVKMEDIINNLGKYGEISKDYIAELKSEKGYAVYEAAKNVFKKNNVKKTTIDSKTKDTTQTINEIKSIVKLFYSCKK